jgi:predicted dehydrogenase
MICGVGSVGQRHLKNLVALGIEDLVLYRTGKGTLSDDEFKHLPTESHLETAIDRWQPQAVVISNPTSLHVEVALAVVNAGSSVLLEKPISHSMENVDDLQKVVADGSVRILVGYQYRFHKGFQKVKSLLNEGAIGDLLNARVVWGEYLPGWHPWEDYRRSYSAQKQFGGGVVLTLSHPFDYLRWMLGEVVSVTAETTQTGQLELDVEDSADIILRFSSRATAQIHLDYLQKPGIHRFELVGTGGKIRWDNTDGRVQLLNTEGDQLFPSLKSEVDDRNQMFLDEMAHFIEVVRGTAAPECTLEDGIRALEIALAVKQSSMQGERITLAAGMGESYL